MNAPDLAYETDPLVLQVLSIVILSVATIIGLQTIWLMARTIKNKQHKRDIKAFRRGPGRKLLSVLDHPSLVEEWCAEAKVYPSTIQRIILLEYLTLTAGDYRAQVVDIYRKLGLLREDLRELKSDSWQRRLVAMRHLSLVASSDERQILLDLKDDHGTIRLLAAQILARVGQGKDLLTMLKQEHAPSRLREHPLRMLLNTAPPEHLATLFENWQLLPDPATRRLVLSEGADRLPSASTKLIPVAAQSQDLEVRIGAAQAAGKLGSHHHQEVLLQLLKDPAWQVRASAASALGNQVGNSAVESLYQSLSDFSFWVRQRAAGSLAGMGDHGLEQLEKAAANHEDPYAADAARTELARLGKIDQEAA